MDDFCSDHDDGNDASSIQQEEDESLGISHQDSGLTDEDLFNTNDEEEDDDVSNLLDEEQSLFSGAWNAAPTADTPPPPPNNSNPTSDRGPLSPFSPLLQSSYTQQQQQDDDSRRISWQQITSEQHQDDFSLQPCRKVSVVVKVKLPQQHDKLCLFPLLPPGIHTESHADTLLSPTSTTLQALSNSTSTTTDLVAVNPSAFGTYIPAQVTMDTARLVANVANIESEDWARRYKFDQVLWPSISGDTTTNTTTTNTPMKMLAVSMGNDAVQWGAPSLCLGVGGTNSGKTQTMFGDNTTTHNQEYGLLGMVVERVLSQLSEHQVCTLSILEIVDEEELRDLLLVNERSTMNNKNALVIRHGTKRGAAVHGLWDAPLDSMTGLGHLMRKAFPSRSNTRSPTREEPRGHVIASLKVWQNGVQLDLQNTQKCTTITLADLASGEEGDGTNEARMASFRKSVSGLRGVLRSLLQQEQDGLAAHAASYRECTLTKVLQRPLLECQTVVLGCVSASAESYERTLHTLNYINRLLIRPGETARSPFQHQQQEERDVPDSPALFDQYGDNEALLKSVVSDPRQRLAKVMPPSRSFTTPVKLQLDEDSAEGYEPIDYMQIDPGAVDNDRGVPSSPMRNDFVDNDDEGGESLDQQQEEQTNLRDEIESNAPTGNGDMVSGPASDWKSTKQGVSGVDTMQFKAVVSLSEESSTQPVDSMSSSARTGLRFGHSPDDVNHEWTASFEEAQSDTYDAIDATHETASSTKLESADALKGANESVEIALEKDDKSSLDDAAMMNLARDFRGVNVSGTSSAVATSKEGSETPKPNNHFKATPFVERMKTSATPKADWPELDDDESALSLTSLQHVLNKDIQASLCDQSPYVTKLTHASSPSRSRHATSSLKVPASKTKPAIPFNIETPSRSLSERKMDQSTMLSPTDQCIGEIHVLEDAVDQIKRLHNGLWETSALSLDRLRHSQELQKQVIDDALNARRDSEAEMERLENALALESEERERDARDYKERLAVLESCIEKARADRSDMEAIAEEAISAQDRLEQELSQTQDELDRQRAAAESAASEYNHELKSSKDLSRQLELAMKSLHEMRSSHGDCKDVIAGLGATIDQLREENEALKEERDASQALSLDQSRVIAEQNRLKQQFGRCQEEISTLQEENARLAADLRDYQGRFEKAEQQQKTLRIQSESENLALQNDVDEWQRRYLEVEDAAERAVRGFAEERTVVLNELSDVKKQLDESRVEVAALRESDAKQRDEEIDFLTSELRELQVERERDRTLLAEAEQKYERLRGDAKDKLKQLTTEKRAAKRTIEMLGEANAALRQSNQELLDRNDHDHRLDESLMEQMSGLLERLEAEQTARREAEERLRQLESERAQTEVPVDKSSTHSSLHLEGYSEAEQALLKQIQAEKSGRSRHSGRLSRGSEQMPSSRVARAPPASASESSYFREQRGSFREFRRELDARHVRDSYDGELVAVHDGEHYSVSEFRAEQARRLQAEDLAAAMAVRAKDGLEKRNKEILNLKIALASVVRDSLT